MHIHILIQDTNQYFVLGLTALLQDNFMCGKINALFVTREHAHLADLLILSSEVSQFMWAYPATTASFRQTVLVIQNPRQRALPHYLHTAGTIRRRDTKETVLQLIEEVWRQSPPSSLKEILNKPLTLTSREYQILSLISQGLSQSLIAWQLKLQSKTVSSHKCSAMRKLGFSHNHDLYHWLRYGGLAKSLASEGNHEI
ncbi:two component system sensor kinase SsrB [Serratia proteamaculans]|uniref:helix-turn-helix transcriptional regulator n=1 Tax=Serratia proteamaculans TaxID=28151 RepID=UPI00217AC9FF|nr:helix-turn-helix transcriptional regulator [Serratia proteamaculans]CAI2021181.1 two component system sensor kinase SsrB [Serratia proteamaculans]